MTQNDVNIVQTFTTEDWIKTKSSPLPVAQSSDATLLPTISDELRWSLQTAVQPLEAGAQMAAAIHGVTTKSPSSITQIVNDTIALFTNTRGLASKTTVDEVSIKSEALLETINRINELTLEKTSTPLLRLYISEMAALHPAILQYIRDNNSTFTYFKPVSETIGLMYTIVADIACSELSKWADVNVLRGQPTSSSAGALRFGTFNKLFPEIGDTVEVAHALCNGYMIRSMPRNSICKFSSDSTTAHGLNNSIDVTSWQNILQAKAQVYSNIVNQLDDQLRLLDQLIPLAANIVIENKVYNMPINKLTTVVDQLGEKIFDRERSTDVLIPYDEQTVKESFR